MLSYSEGRPFAVIKGGILDGEILHVSTTDENACCKKHSKHCVLRKCCKKCDPKFSKIMIDDGKLQQIPNTETREVAYIAGPSGSGKSTYAADYISKFKTIFPDKDVYVFSRLADDKIIDDLDVIRVKIDEELITDPINISEEFKDGGLVLFDDVDTIQDKKLKDAVSKLKNDILETGRHQDLYTVNTSHLVNPNDRKDGRTIMNEAHTLTVFPKSGSSHSIEYALKNYLGFSKDQIKTILNLPSRWVTIYKSYPQIVMYEKGAYLP